MKRIGITLLILIYATLLEGQNPFYDQVMRVIKKNYPELVTANKIIAVNIWTVEDLISRETNQAFDKTMKVYEVAKLEGGTKGFIAVAINLDDLNSAAQATFASDGNTKLLSLKYAEFEKVKQVPSHNIVFNSLGVILCEDIKAESVFNAIHKLVTR